jgi:MFS family permease
MRIPFVIFALFIMACAMAPNWHSLLVFRLLAGIFGSAPVAVAPGILADMFLCPRARGYAIAVFMTVCTLFAEAIYYMWSSLTGDE